MEVEGHWAIPEFSSTLTSLKFARAPTVGCHSLVLLLPTCFAGTNEMTLHTPVSLLFVYHLRLFRDKTQP